MWYKRKRGRPKNKWMNEVLKDVKLERGKWRKITYQVRGLLGLQ